MKGLIVRLWPGDILPNSYFGLGRHPQAADFDDLVITVHRDKLGQPAVDALGELLHDLHVYKCTGNTEGIAYYADKTNVGDYAKYRDVVIAKKRPRKQLIQANTVAEGDKVTVREYDESEVGMIQSFAERHV